MRALVAVLALASAFVVTATWFGGPALAASIVRLGLDASGFEGSDTEVEIRADPPLMLLAGLADSVRIRSRDATIGSLGADRLDLTLGDVGLFDRSVRTIAGRLDQVVVSTADGRRIALESIALDGPIEHAAAVLTMSAAEFERAAERGLQAAGVPATNLRLEAPGAVGFEVAGRSVRAAFAVSGTGDLILASNAPGLSTVRLIAADSVRPLRFRTVSFAAGRLVIAGSADMRAVLD